MAAFSQLCREIGEKEHVVAIAWTLRILRWLHPSSAFAPSSSWMALNQAVELELSPEILEKLDDIFSPNHGRQLRVGQAPEAYAW